jgi:NADPH-dependent 2,4-dienoyl-CoA reductase/sulfur reductase-like enzyme
MRDVAVIGAGPAGVSMALSLRDRGIRPLLIDRADEVGSAWRSRYDVLKLNTGRPFSHLPNRPYPKGTPIYPSRDDVVAHLDGHAREDGIELRLGTAVDRIDRRSTGWRLATSGDPIDARHVVVATGLQSAPVMLDAPGMDAFTGELLHSSAYRNPASYQGKRVLIVGSGSSGMEIAHDLATGGAAKVWLAVRTPPNIMLRRGPGGLPGDVIAVPLYHAPIRIGDAISRKARRAKLGDLSEIGLPIPAEGPFARLARERKVPSLVDMEVIEAIKAGSIEVVAAVKGFDGGTVRLVDGAALEADAVICATGYRTGLEPLVGHLGVLDETGVPVVTGEKAAAEGLRFLGFSSRPIVMGYVARQSKRVAKQIAGELHGG